MNNWFVDHHHIFKQTKKFVIISNEKIIESFTCQPIDIFIILKVTGLNLEKKNSKYRKWEIFDCKTYREKESRKMTKMLQTKSFITVMIGNLHDLSQFFFSFCKWRSLTTFSVHRTVYLGQIYTDHLIYGLSTSSSPTI